MFCMKCGTKLPDDAMFCYKCGTKLPKMASEDTEETEVIATKNVDEELETDDEKQEENESESLPEEFLNDRFEEHSNNSLESCDGISFNIVENYSVVFPSAICSRMFFESILNRERTLATEAFEVLWSRWKKEDRITKLEDIFTVYVEKVFKIADIAIETGFRILLENGITNVTKQQIKDSVTDNYNSTTDLSKSLALICSQLNDYAQQLAIDKELNKTRFVGGGFGITNAIIGSLKASAMNTAADSLKSFGKFITGNSDKAKMARFQKKLFEEEPWEAYGFLYINNIFFYIEFFIEDIFTSKGIIGPNIYRQDDAEATAKNMRDLYHENRISKDRYLQSLCNCIEMSRERVKFIESFYLLRNDALPGLLKIAEFTGDYLYILDRVRTLTSDERENIVKKYAHNTSETLRDVVKHAVVNQQDLENFLDLRSFTLMGQDPQSVMIVYLVEGNYKIPLNKEKVKYIGLGNVKATIESDRYINFKDKDISFYNIAFDSAYNKITNDYLKEHFDTGKKLLLSASKEEFKKAYDILNNCANNGDSEMKYQVAVTLQDGLEHCPEEDVPLVETRIEDLLLKAADNGHAGACLVLGLGDWELEKGKAAYLFVAEEHGSAEAAYRLGNLFKEGHKDVGGKINIDLAKKYYQKAIDGGYSEAVNTLEELDSNYKNLKTTESYINARDYLKSFNIEEAIKCYKVAAENNHVKALYELGLIYKYRKPNTYENTVAAKECFEKAVSCGGKVAVVEKMILEDKKLESLIFKERIMKLINNHIDEFKDAYDYGGEFAFYPDISPKKLENAIETYGRKANVNSDDVLYLYDSTIMGSGKDGFILTPNAFIRGNSEGTFNTISLSDIDHLENKDDKGNLVAIFKESAIRCDKNCSKFEREMASYTCIQGEFSSSRRDLFIRLFNKLVFYSEHKEGISLQNIEEIRKTDEKLAVEFDNINQAKEKAERDRFVSNIILLIKTLQQKRIDNLSNDDLYNNANYYLKHSDVNEATKYFILAADKGHVRSMLKLGTGDFGLNRNSNIIYLRRAEKAGSAEASYYIGKLYEEGHESIGYIDFYEAENHYKNAADAGYNDAISALDALDAKRKDKGELFKVAQSYMSFAKASFGEASDFTDELISEVEKRYLDAIHEGSEEAKKELCELYCIKADNFFSDAETGKKALSKQNYENAKKLYQKAVDLGESKGLIGLGNICASNSDFYDFDKALALYKNAEMDYKELVKKPLSVLYYKQANLLMKKGDYTKAEELALESIGYGIYGNNNGKKLLLYIYELQGDAFFNKGDFVNAIEWYQKIADFDSSPNAKQKLGNAYYSFGKEYNDKQDYDKAIEYYLKSSDLGNSKAMFSLGCIYEADDYPDKNYETAEKWYVNACRKGNKAAITRLPDLYLTIGDDYYNNRKNEENYLEKALEYYDKASENFPEKVQLKRRSLYKDLGDKFLKLKDLEKALSYYNQGLALYNGDCASKIGSIYGSPTGNYYDYYTALWYYQTGVKLNGKNAVQRLTEFKKQIPIRERLFNYCSHKAIVFKDSKYSMSGYFKEDDAAKASQAYGNNVAPSTICLLYNKSGAKVFGFSFGKKKQEGFFITQDGFLMSSIGCRLDLNNVLEFQIKGTNIVAYPSNSIIAELKDVTEEDLCFVESFNNEILCNDKEGGYEAYIPLRLAVQEFNDKFGSQNCYYSGDLIPTKKLSNVLSSYARWKNIDAKNVLMLIDTTTFGNAKDGCIITDKNIISSTGLTVELKMGDRLTYSTGQGVYWRGQKLFDATFNDERDNSFVEIFNKALQISKENSHSFNQQQKCSNCGSVISEASVFCPQCGARLR